MAHRSRTPRTPVAKDRAAQTAKAPSLVPSQDPPDEAADAGALSERIVVRPDGYYWQALDGNQEIGPFENLAEAQADMDSGDTLSWVPGETLSEAESEIGIADWIDPDSGELAEGQSTPHLGQE